MLHIMGRNSAAGNNGKKESIPEGVGDVSAGTRFTWHRFAFPLLYVTVGILIGASVHKVLTPQPGACTSEAKDTGDQLKRCHVDLEKMQSSVQSSTAETKAIAKKLSACENAAAVPTTTTTTSSSSSAKKAVKVAASKMEAEKEHISKCEKDLEKARSSLSECDNQVPHLRAALDESHVDLKKAREKLSICEHDVAFDDQRAAVASNASMVERNTLFAQVSLLSLLPNGTIRVPEGTRRIFLEVGPNSHLTMDVEQLQQFEDAFLISFEPMLHQYAALLARKSEPDKLNSLGEHHERGVVLPFAIAPTNGMMDLHTAGSADFCASLLRPQNAKPLHRECADPSLPLDSRQVPAVRLETALGWLAWRHGSGWPIDFLKLDAGGMEIEVLRSAGKQLPRILRVQLDVHGDSCPRLYIGSLTCSETVAAMQDLGYHVAYNRSCTDFEDRCYEDSWEFLRSGMRPLHFKKLPWRSECWHGELSGLRDSCCENLQKGLLQGCFNHEYTVHRCCAHRWLPGAKAEPAFI